MLITLIPVAVIMLTIIFAFWKVARTERMLAKRHQWTFQFIEATRRLVEHIPQHRGMANALLKGDSSFRDKMLALQGVIEKDFKNLSDVSSNKYSVFEQSSFQSIHSDWRSIEKQVFNFSPETSFAQHSILISRLLDLIEDTCELTSLYEFSEDDVLLIRALAKDLPRLTETLGQARGVGAGVAAQASCSVGEQLKLKFLADKCSNIFDNTISPLLNSREGTLKLDQGLFRACLDTGQGFIQTVRRDLIDASEIRIDSTEYYNNATQAIEVSFKLFDSLLAVVKK